VTLRRLHVQNGFDRSGDGGGGIHNKATLSVIDSEITDNNVTDDGVNPAPEIRGGGIFNDGGTLTLNRSTVADNTANDAVNGEGEGGGVANISGSLTATNSTISGNVAKEQPDGFWDPQGGGLWERVGGGASMTLVSDTISDNSVTSPEPAGDGGGIFIVGVGPSDTIGGTIVAGNTAPGIDDCYGTFTSTGSNLIGPVFGCTLLGGSNDLTGSPAVLGPLADYGGPTRTHYLNPGSPAIDHGGSCPVTDQRGLFRAPAAPCDTGAFELNAASSLPAGPAPSVVAPAGPTGQRAAALAKCKKKKGKKRKKCKKKAMLLPV
jgi:hypothetical protein